MIGVNDVSISMNMFKVQMIFNSGPGGDRWFDIFNIFNSPSHSQVGVEWSLLLDSGIDKHRWVEVLEPLSSVEQTSGG